LPDKHLIADKICAIDSSVLKRGGKKAPAFKAPIGVAVTISGCDEFKSSYTNGIDSLLKKYSRRRDCHVYSSSGIMKLFNNPAESDHFFEDLFALLVPYIERVDFCYTYFTKDQTSMNVSIYGNGPTPVNCLSPIKLIEQHLLNSYPHLCAWQFLDSVPSSKSMPIYVDMFQSETTQAWLKVRSATGFSVFSKGDECNAFISVADMFLKIINNRLFKARKGLYPDDIEGILRELPSKVFTHFLGYKYLSNIVPTFPRQIDLREKMKHPMIFLMKEPKNAAVPNEAYEDSPLWRCMKNYAFNADGCVKFFNAEHDHSLLKEGDVITYSGPESERAAKIIQRTGYPVTIMPPEKLLSDHYYRKIQH